MSTERENRQPQVIKYLEGKRQPYMPRPTIETEHFRNPNDIVYEKEECIICFDEFKTIESQVVILECGEIKNKNHNEIDVKSRGTLITTCTKGHNYETLTSSPYGVSRNNEFAAICDKCQAKIRIGEQFQHCRICSEDLCPNCSYSVDV